MYADVAKFFFVEDFNLSSVHSDESLLGEIAEGSYGVGGNHIGHVSEVLARHIHSDGALVLVESVLVLEAEDRLCESSADVLLGEAHGLDFGFVEVGSHLLEDDEAETAVIAEQGDEEIAGNAENRASLVRCGTGAVAISCDDGAVSKERSGLEHTEDLHALAVTLLADFDLTFEEDHSIFGGGTIVVNDLSLGEFLNTLNSLQHDSLRFVQRLPYRTIFKKCFDVFYIVVFSHKKSAFWCNFVIERSKNHANLQKKKEISKFICKNVIFLLNLHSFSSNRVFVSL